MIYVKVYQYDGFIKLKCKYIELLQYDRRPSLIIWEFNIFKRYLGQYRHFFYQIYHNYLTWQKEGKCIIATAIIMFNCFTEFWNAREASHHPALMDNCYSLRPIHPVKDIFFFCS